MATILYPDGKTAEVQPRNGTDFQLDELRGIVAGHIEIVPLPDGRIMVCNEESKVLGLPRNEAATSLAQLPSPQERWIAKVVMEELGYSVIDATGGEEDYIAGTVLVCEDQEVR